MIHLKEILIPTDFSETSNTALGHGLMLAERFDARLTMLHVAAEANNPQIHFPAVDPQTDENELIAERQFSEMAGLKPQPRLRMRRIVRMSNNPAEEISRFAQENECDLIVAGTHGRTGLSHWVTGSVAESVMRNALCPVMLVRQSETAAQVMPYLNILTPIDFSPDSKKALPYAWTLARLFDASLHLLHVVDMPAQPEHYANNNDFAEQLRLDLTQRSLQEMQQLTSSLAGEVRHATHVEVGRAYSEIVKFAESHEVDLIVMGTHGLSGLRRFLFGGTTANVVRHAPCPVLTVKLHERDFVDLPASTPEA